MTTHFFLKSALINISFGQVYHKFFTDSRKQVSGWICIFMAVSLDSIAPRLPPGQCYQKTFFLQRPKIVQGIRTYFLHVPPPLNYSTTPLIDISISREMTIVECHFGQKPISFRIVGGKDSLSSDN